MAQVQKNSGTVNGVTTIAPTLGSATTAGNSILLFVSSAGTLTTPAGFTSRSPQVNLQGCYLFDKLVASGNATDTPSMTQGGTFNAIWFIAEYSGITAFRNSNGANANVSPHNVVYTTGTVTPAAGATLLVGYVGFTGSTQTATYAAGDPQGWTNSFVSQQSLLQTGTVASGRDSLACGWSAFQVTANGSTAYSTGALVSCSTSSAAPHRIISSYAHSVAAATKGIPLFGMQRRFFTRRINR